MRMAELLSLFPLFGSFLVSYASAREYKFKECKVIANPFTEGGGGGGVKEVTFMGILQTLGILWTKSKSHSQAL